MTQSTIRITKEFRFEAAHALWGYDGACRNVHGHSYLLYVCLKGKPVSNTTDPKYGMIMDFSVLKKIVKELIVDVFDHALMVNKNTPHKLLAHSEPALGKVLLLDYQPTCENMVSDFAARIGSNLPTGIKLHSLRLHETTTAYAEWYAEDNP